MFDLETAIADWKQSLVMRDSFSSDDISELESHLRDCVSSLSSMGLSGEEAFLIAQRRVGQPSELDAEFAKESSSTRWVHRGKWMCIGVLMLILVRSIGSLLFGTVRLVGSPSELDPMTLTITYNWVAIASSWSLALIGLFVLLWHETWIDSISQRFGRIPKPVLIGVPMAAILSLTLLMSFNIYMTSGYGHTALRLSMLAYQVSTPILLLAAAYVLHRSEQRRAVA